MVAKIFFSTSFLITRLALTPSFSESSLTVMPSAMVISRSMGGGSKGFCAPRHRPKTTLFRHPLPAAAVARAGFGGVAAAGFRRAAPRVRRAEATSDASDARAAVRRTVPPGPPGPRATRTAGTAHQGLSRTNRTGINRTAGHRTRGAAVGIPGRGAPGAERRGMAGGARRATISARGGTTGRAAGCPARFGLAGGRNGVHRQIGCAGWA